MMQDEYKEPEPIHRPEVLLKEYEFLLLDNDCEQKIKAIGSPKTLVISGIVVIILGCIAVYQILSGANFFLWLVLLLLSTLVFLNSYSNYEEKVAVNNSKVDNINFKINQNSIVTSLNYFIPFDKKGPRLSTTKFKYENIDLITYCKSKKLLTIVSKYTNLIEFDNPNFEDITNDYEKCSEPKTIVYKIDLNGNYDMLNLIQSTSKITLDIF